MDATEISKAVVEWAVAKCPDLNSVYDQDTDSIEHALPVALAVVGAEGDETRASGLEQATLHTAQVSLEFLVRDEDEAAEILQGFVATLGAAIRDEYRLTGDVTLDGRVGGGSPDWSAEYEPPYAIFDDSTKARRASFSLTVAELL